MINGSLVEDLRLAKGISKSRLAVEAGISLSYLRDLVIGRRPHPSSSVRARLALALGIRPESLGSS